MQGNAKRQLKNAALFANLPPSSMPGVGGPYKYSGKEMEYFEEATSAYVFENSKYAANYYKAEVQGVMPGSFDTKRGAYIRSMDIVEQTTGAKMPNDYQAIYFQDTRIKGLYTGAKVKYGGNTWLAISPFNVADPLSQAVVRRCNAVWRHYDYYGNIKTEPFVFHDGRASATANEYLDWSVIPNWYQKCVMQLNNETRELAYNRRMVLGSSVVQLRGIVDFVSDFTGETPTQTGESEPSHVLFFDVQYDQPTENDDMINGIADGKSFKWEILAAHESIMNIGGVQTVGVKSLRNNEEPDTQNYSVSYLFSSSDESVATVTQNGKIKALNVGETVITVYLEQNQNITTSFQLTVQEEKLAPTFLIDPPLPSAMEQLQKYSGSVSVANGDGSDEDGITVTAKGGTYAASVVFDSSTGQLEINAYEASDIPILVTIESKKYGLTHTQKIELEGF